MAQLEDNSLRQDLLQQKGYSSLVCWCAELGCLILPYLLAAVLELIKRDNQFHAPTTPAHRAGSPVRSHTHKLTEDSKIGIFKLNFEKSDADTKEQDTKEQGIGKAEICAVQIRLYSSTPKGQAQK